MKELVITEFVSLIMANDPQGLKREFTDRFSACFIVTLRGRIRFIYEGGEVTAEPGHAVFLPKGLHYVNECVEQAVSAVFNFQTLCDYQAPVSLGTVSEAVLEECCARINGCTYAPGEQSRLTILETLYALARRLLIGCGEEEKTHPIVAKAMQYMRRNCGNAELSVTEVAQYCCISEVYLRKLFRSTVQASPHEKLTEIRMEKARLLAEEKRPVKEIAAEVGYCDAAQFSRAYKRYYGYAPTKG